MVRALYYEVKKNARGISEGEIQRAESRERKNEPPRGKPRGILNVALV
jgi:hypothetical protein